nr:GNAT family N-acetyltransferase [Clostridiales bacterium]
FRNLPTLETPRLTLRKLRMRDAEDVYSWSRDPDVARYVLWTAHQNVRETRDYIRYVRSLYRRGLPSSWGIELKETGRVIGTMGVMAWIPEYRVAEVGYSLGKKWWRQGYAAEALSALMDLMFDEMRINRVEGQCDVRNPASGRVMEKCGMRREGLLRQRVRNKGETVDVLLYAAIAADRENHAAAR